MKTFVEQRMALIMGTGPKSPNKGEQVEPQGFVMVDGYEVRKALDLTGQPRQDSDWWVAQGKPECWHMVEEQSFFEQDGTIFGSQVTVQAWLDSAYGQIAMTVNGKYVGTAKNFLLSPDGRFAVIDRGYYGTPVYLYGQLEGLRLVVAGTA